MMSDDDILARLGADWREQPVDLDAARRTLRKRERWIAVWRMAHFAAGIAAPLIGGWFAYRAWTGSEPIFVVATVAMLLVLPLMLVEFRSINPDRRTRLPLDTPVAVLLHAQRQAAISLKLVRTTRWSGIILLGCAMLACILYWAGQLAPESAKFLVSVWTLAGVLALAWQRRRSRRLLAEIEGCKRHLAAFSEADARDA